MAVNENVYGAKNLWYDAFFQQSALTNKNKIPYFDENKSTLIDGVTAGKLSFSEPIDKTISYCGLGTECALSHIAYTNFVNNNVEITDIQDRIVTNFGFFEKSNITQYIANATAFYYDNINWIKWGDYENLSNYQRLLSPLTLVNPHNVVLAINVSAYDSNMSNHITTSLYNYILYNTSTHPNIDRVTIQPFYGDISLTSQRDIYGGKGNVTYRIPFQLSVLDEYRIQSKNVNFYSYGIDGFPVFGNVQNLPYTYNSTNVFGMILHTENSLPHIKIVPSSNDTTYIYTEYYPEFEQDIIKTVACFGLYFSPIVSIARSGSLTDNDMYIGILDSDGIGHGEYLRGSNTVNAPQNNYTDMSDSGYDHTKYEDNTKYQNDTQFYTAWTSSAFTKMYVLRGSDVSSLANELYTAVAAAPTGDEIERYNQSVFLTQNPIDCVISLKKFPIEFFATTWQPVTPIKLGSYTCNTNGSPLPYTTGVYNFTFSNSTNNGLYPWFDKSFLDYEPYTKCELTIPFCGTVEIPTTYLHDYDTIDVKLIVDFITGACTAYIQARNITIDSVSGECAVSLPVNGIQSATLDSQIHSAATARNKSALTNGLGLIGGLAAVGIGIATGGIGTAVIGGIAALTSGANMVIQDKNIEYELQHMQVPMKQVSGASGAINQSYDMRCKMRITRPKISDSYDAEVYANTVGFACLINTTVNTLSGLTVGDINLNGLDASDVEKQLIKNAFASGVIL